MDTAGPGAAVRPSSTAPAVGPGVGVPLCTVEHVGLVLSGTATAEFDDGTVVELHAGNLFHIPARPHDSWVVGDEPYVSLHFLGADHYAK